MPPILRCLASGVALALLLAAVSLPDVAAAPVRRGQEDSGFSPSKSRRSGRAVTIPAFRGFEKLADNETPPIGKLVLSPAPLPRKLFNRVMNHVRDYCDFQGTEEEVGGLCCLAGTNPLAKTGRRITACMNIVTPEPEGDIQKAVYREAITSFTMGVMEPMKGADAGKKKVTFFKLTPTGLLQFAEREVVGDPQAEAGPGSLLNPTPELVDYWKETAREALGIARQRKI